MIDRESRLHDIIFCNKDHESLIQILILITWFGDIRIDQCTVVSGSLSAGTSVTPLNLYIKYAIVTIDCKNVQLYGSSLQILNTTLAVCFQNTDTFIVQDYPQ